MEDPPDAEGNYHRHFDDCQFHYWIKAPPDCCGSVINEG